MKMTLTEAEYLRLYGHAVDELKPALPPARVSVCMRCYLWATSIAGNFDTENPFQCFFELFYQTHFALNLIGFHINLLYSSHLQF